MNFAVQQSTNAPGVAFGLPDRVVKPLNAMQSCTMAARQNRMRGDMDNSDNKTAEAVEQDAPRRVFSELPPAAQRALREAEERRAAAKTAASDGPREIGGRGGKDPARFGDWEIKGIACDF